MNGINLNVDHNLKDLERALRGLSKQIPFAVSQTINNTLKSVQKAEKRQVLKVFKSPVGATKNPTFISFAKRNKLSGFVQIKNGRGGGANVARYLRAQIEGGQRNFKGLDTAISRKAKLSGRKQFVPAKRVRNKFGNITKSRARKISKGLGNGGRYFYQAPQGSSRAGVVYERVSKNKIRPVMYQLEGTARYNKSFDYFGTAHKAANRWMGVHMTRALKNAIKHA